MPVQYINSLPTLECISIVLKSETEVASILAGLDDGWTIEAVENTEAGEFDLVPPNSHLSEREIFDLVSELKAQPGVLEVDPMFETGELGDERPLPNLSQPTGDGPVPEAPLASDAFDWSWKFVGAGLAWEIEPTRGAGIRIGHPDSGYLTHNELGQNYKPADGKDFVFPRNQKIMNNDGGHGLGTASVIGSPDNRGTLPRSVTGIAPGATIIPYRVTRKHLLVLPAPILLQTGARRLRKAIRQAVKDDIHVISISLGCLASLTLRKAVKEAEAANVIIVAAAGNGTGPILVAPAKYKETICLAGCTADADQWAGSSRGYMVDVTGPAKHVWKAVDMEKGYIKQGSGTSHATATTAGIAALWLKKHHRSLLLERYEGAQTLTEVFRECLMKSATPHGWDKDKWGAGFVNAPGCLNHTLPPPIPSMYLETRGPTPLEDLASSLDMKPAEFAEKLAVALGADLAAVVAAVDMHHDELEYHLATKPGLRNAMRVDGPEMVILDEETVSSGLSKSLAL